MNVYNDYKNKLALNMIRGHALRGEIASPESIIIQYDHLLRNMPSIGDVPLTSIRSRSIIPRKEITLESYQSLLMDAKFDLEFMRSYIVEQYKYIANFMIEWNIFTKNIIGLLTRVNNDLTQRLFFEEESAGFFEAVEDSFNSFELIDRDMTTANVDISKGLVAMAATNNVALSSYIDPVLLNVRLVNNFIGGNESFVSIAGHDLSFVLNYESDFSWIGMGFSNIPKAGQVSLFLELNIEKEISAIEIERNFNVGTGQVECYSSIDNVNWDYFGEARGLSESLIFTSEKRNVKFIRINITKNNYDHHRPDTGYQYKFEINNIKLHRVMSSYEEDMSYVVQSIGHNVSPYNKAALSVCDINGDSTNIKYYLSQDGENWTITSPLNKEPSSYPSVVSFSGSNIINSLDNDSNRIDSDQAVTKVIATSEVEGLNTLNNVVVINYELSPTEMNLINRKGISIYKDVIKNNIKDGGWIDKDGYVNGHFFIPDNNLTIDFGSSIVWLDNTQITGVKNINSGWHSIRVSKDYYFDVDGVFNNEIALKRADRLYPYNVKYLIEGYKYPSGFIGEKIYKGISLRAGGKIVQANSFADFQNNLDKFYIDVKENGNYVFLIHKPESLIEIRDFEYLISYNKVEDSYTQIYFKAELSSLNKEVSPLLLSYLIKVGM